MDGPIPTAGTPIILDGKEVGELRSGREGRGLALIRLEHLDSPNAHFTANGATISPRKPDWADF